MDTKPFDANSKHEFNFCKMIAGSEGSLCFMTEIKLHLNTLPPKEIALVSAHHHQRSDVGSAGNHETSTTRSGTDG